MHLAVVRTVVEDGCVGARAHDAAVRGALRSIAPDRLQQQRFDLVLVHSGTCVRHRAQMRVAGDARRGLHRVEVLRPLEQPHLVEDRRRVRDLGRPEDARTRTTPRRVEPFEHAIVEAAVTPEPVIEALAVGQKLRQLRLELVDRERLVGPVLRLGAIDPGARAIPDLSLGIASTHEHGGRLVFGFRRCGEHEDALRLVEPREVEQVRVLSVLVVHIVVSYVSRRRRKDRQGRFARGRHRCDDMCPATCVEVSKARVHGFISVCGDPSSQAKSRQSWPGGTAFPTIAPMSHDRERRRKRSPDPLVALHYQLTSTRREASLETIVVADGSGVVVAGAGSWAACEELAAFAPLIDRGDCRQPVGRVVVRDVEIDGDRVLLCARGSDQDVTTVGDALKRAAQGISRILRAA